MTHITRRDFSVTATLAAAGWLVSGSRPPRAVAGPFGPEDLADFPVPADKKLDPQWLASLSARGAPIEYRSSRDELSYIGMPIGGICTGLLYLGGDGKLWLWDIFNQPAAPTWGDSSGPHYAKPVQQTSPLVQNFGLRVTAGGQTTHRNFDITGWADIAFRGEYPIGKVEYRQPGLPVEASLEAFSPFCPLEPDDSGLPATVMNFTVRNTSAEPVEIAVAGWMQNAVCLASEPDFDLVRHVRVKRQNGLIRVDLSAAIDPRAEERRKQERPPVVFDRFESDRYENWETTGEAFGDGPRLISSLPGYMGQVNGEGQRVVNSHHTQNGEDVGKADTYVGTLLSREFTIERRFISFRFGGGNHPGQTAFNLLVDGAPVRTTTGRNSNFMQLHNWDVTEFEGRKARLQAVDAWTGGWGQIGLDDVVFCDSPRRESGRLEDRGDYGTLSLGMIVPPGTVVPGLFSFDSVNAQSLPAAAFTGDADSTAARPIASIGRSVTLKPGESQTFKFIVGWHFDGLWRDYVAGLQGGDKLRRHYGTRFRSAADVVDYVAGSYDLLATRTRTWHSCWYDSTLPWWLLHRTMAPASTLATTTCFRFDNNRFYAWEGTHCCAGTCTHVWSYAHSVGRLFPQLERSAREMADYGVAFHEDTGAMDYRAEYHKVVAHDGQCGTILRTYREHQMSPDDAFLRRVWPRVRKAVEHMIREDRNQDGLLEGAQYNTLDTTWYGEMAWLSSYYMAALRAGAAMAREMGDDAFAAQCDAIVASGSRLIVDRLFNGEYFYHRTDPAHPESNNTNNGCHGDQLMGQAWAWQVGLDRVVPAEQTVTALKSLWRYNFTPDVGPYRKALKDTIKGGRWYAMPGEGGLIVCTFPKGGATESIGKGNDAWATAYFNECWTGFEHQVAGHMLYEGLVQEGLAICRMAEDRHHASRRNPWNEVECSSHYARGMASHGVFLAACGFEYHGPKCHIGFAPRLSPNNFKAAFTAAQGWGTFAQSIQVRTQRCELNVAYGQVQIRTFALAVSGKTPGVTATVAAANQPMKVTVTRSGDRLVLDFGTPLLVRPGEPLVITLTLE
ncbi:MAG: hypothetical protein GIKADHBN_00328 [Phycisphaerales bacterium]|nr:hypothetical protein [Phycisphaerales bacterium]